MPASKNVAQLHKVVEETARMAAEQGSQRQASMLDPGSFQMIGVFGRHGFRAWHGGLLACGFGDAVRNAWPRWPDESKRSSVGGREEQVTGGR